MVFSDDRMSTKRLLYSALVMLPFLMIILQIFGRQSFNTVYDPEFKLSAPKANVTVSHEEDTVRRQDYNTHYTNKSFLQDNGHVLSQKGALTRYNLSKKQNNTSAPGYGIWSRFNVIGIQHRPKTMFPFGYHSNSTMERVVENMDKTHYYSKLYSRTHIVLYKRRMHGLTSRKLEHLYNASVHSVPSSAHNNRNLSTHSELETINILNKILADHYNTLKGNDYIKKVNKRYAPDYSAENTSHSTNLSGNHSTKYYSVLALPIDGTTNKTMSGNIILTKQSVTGIPDLAQSESGTINNNMIFQSYIVTLFPNFEIKGHFHNDLHPEVKFMDGYSFNYTFDVKFHDLGFRYILNSRNILGSDQKWSVDGNLDHTKVSIKLQGGGWYEQLVQCSRFSIKAVEMKNSDNTEIVSSSPGLFRWVGTSFNPWTADLLLRHLTFSVSNVVKGVVEEIMKRHPCGPYDATFINDLSNYLSNHYLGISGSKSP